MNSKLFEHILGYSDHDGIGRNELVEPLEEDNLEELFEDVYFEGYLEPLFERIFYECNVNLLTEQTLREMSSPTSKTLAQTFVGILKGIGFSEKEPITDEKLSQATNETINRYGAGNKEGLNFNFSENERNSDL